MNVVLLFKLLSVITGAVAVVGPTVAIAGAIFFPTIVLPLISRIWRGFLDCRFCVVVVAVIIACLVSFWVGRNGAYKEGVDDTVARIARNDAKLVGRALAQRSKLKACQEQGQRWDQTTGACR